MKITSKQLKRIIKEEHRKLQREGTHPDDIYESLFQILDQALTKMGVDRLADPDAAENVAAALEKIAGEVRSEIGSELDEYGSGKFGDRSKKPTGEQMGCKDRRTGTTAEPYWNGTMGKWVCP